MRTRSKTQLVPKARSVAERTKSGLAGSSTSFFAVMVRSYARARDSTAALDLGQFQGKRIRLAIAGVRMLRRVIFRSGLHTRVSQSGISPGIGDSGPGILSAKTAARMLPPDTEAIVRTWERIPSSFRRRRAPAWKRAAR